MRRSCRTSTTSSRRAPSPAIVGPSGSGKTSLLRLLLGTERPQHGDVVRAPGVAVSYVPQLETVNWNFPVTVGECVLMARPTRRLLPWATPQEKAEVAEVLERLGIGGLASRHIRELSGGQQQRMFIARALLRRPDLLLMDEPTSGVDVATRHEVLHLLDELNAEGLAILLTTHDLNGMAAHLPHLVALNTRVIARGPAVGGHRPRRPRAHLRRAHGGAAAPRHAGRRRQRVARRAGGGGVIGTLLEPFHYQFVVNGIYAAVLAGGICGLLGVFITLRGMSYIGHGLSHAVFGGYAAAPLLGVPIVLGAGAWGLGSALLINAVARSRRIGADAAIGVVTTASFALGVALLTRFGTKGPAFDALLFGSINGVGNDDLLLLVGALAFAALTFTVLYRSFLFTTFDPDVAEVSGVSVKWMDALLMLVLSVSILATLQIIGVTLVAATLVIPAVVVRMLTDSFSRMLWSLDAARRPRPGRVGMYLSYHLAIPSGTTIVLLNALAFVVALVCTGPRGLRRAAGHGRPRRRPAGRYGGRGPLVRRAAPDR